MGRLVVDNRSGYSTADLRRFFARGLRALGAKGPTTIVVTSSPIRSRGCSEVGRGGREGRRMTIAIASPSHFSLRRLARLFVHEVRHKQGLEHRQMTREDLWSLGGVPDWARGARIRYLGRAPRQL